MHFVSGSKIDFVPASHEDPNDPGVLKRVLLTHADLIEGQIMMVNWARLPREKSFQPHYHEDMQEVFVLLEGRATMTVNDQEFAMGPADALVVDPREVHSMRNTCDGDVTYLVFGVSMGQGGKTINLSD